MGLFDSRLSDYATGRDNNFNLVRFLAAFAVLWSHSYALVLGGAHEPWVQWLGYTPAGIAVDVFFITSGFLVTASLLRLDSFKAFVRARSLRIFPALVVMSLLLTFVLGPWFTTRPLAEYFAERETWTFLVKNATVLTGVKFKLDGMFPDNPMDRVVNGSLWTLPFELRCYLSLAFVYWLAGFFTTDKLRRFTQYTVILAAVLLATFWWAHMAGYRHWHTFRLFWFFFCGAVLWIYRTRVPMHGGIFVAACALLAVGAVVPKYFFWLYAPTIAYIVLWFAYVPGGWMRGFNRLGDYSYGVYIYAFPVQQAVIATAPDMGALGVFAWATAITLPLAMASWHWIEKPALARKAGGAKH
jgi:peptidoglycan/LPS O-acetylase OafA/YrhL